jgi:hypothetical protein
MRNNRNNTSIFSWNRPFRTRLPHFRNFSDPHQSLAWPQTQPTLPALPRRHEGKPNPPGSPRAIIAALFPSGRRARFHAVFPRHRRQPLAALAQLLRRLRPTRTP